MRGAGLYAIAAGFALGIAYGTRYGFAPIEAAALSVGITAFALGFLVVRRPAYLLVLMFLLALLAGGIRAASVPTELPHAFAPMLERRVELEGTLVRQPDVREGSVRLTLETAHAGSGTRIIAVAPPYGTYLVGDVVLATGVLRLPESFATDGGRTFAYDKFLAKDGVFALVQPAQITVVGRDERMHYAVLRLLQSVREHFVQALECALPEPESALASGLITGGKQGLGKELLDAFTIAGLIHIVVLSGYNVMIVAEAVLRGLGFLPRRLALLTAGVVIALFVLMAGAGAAALRAGVMALLGLLARATRRTYAVLRALAVALTGMLLFNPLLLMHDPGFQFSFVATLGLILLAPHIEAWLAWMRPALLRDIAAATFAAQIAVLPILLFHTGNLSLVAFVVNLLVLPVIPLAMGAATLAAGVALVAPSALDALVLFVGLPAQALLAYVIGVAEVAADLPLAYMIVPAFPFWVVGAAYAGIGFWLYKAGARASAHAPVRSRTV